MRVLLIQPPTGLYRRDDRCQSRVEDQTIRVDFPPMDLAYHAAVLEAHGIDCAIHDFSSARTSLVDALEVVRSAQPDVVFFSVTQPTRNDDLAFCQRLRELLPSLKIILRGDAIAWQDQEILAEHPAVALILRGETEYTLLEVCQALDNPAQWAGIAGISYQSTEGFVRTPDRPFIEDLDQLPWPARHLLDQTLYRSPETGRMIATIYGSRGCPHNCIFCPARRVSGKTVRLRKVEQVVAEMAECVNRYGIRDFLFHGDTFTWSRDWVLALCRGIQEQGLKVRWGCNSRVDTIDLERLQAMRRAGCWVVGYGVESGDPETLRQIRKGVNRDQIQRAIQLTRQSGLRSHAFFVIGFPWEDHIHLETTLRFIRELDPDFFDINIAYPLPGTALLEMVQAEGLFEPTQLNQGGYSMPAVRTRFLSSQELDQWRRQALLRLYLRPRYIARTLLRSGSPNRLWHYLRAGWFRLRNLTASKPDR